MLVGEFIEKGGRMHMDLDTVCLEKLNKASQAESTDVSSFPARMT